RIGSGKTTIEKLVLGLYEPDQGAVLIDGTDLRQIDPADLRRNVGCVLQDVFLFHGTIRDNITLGAPFADDHAVLRAARIAGVEDFVSRHPSGFDLNVGERGESLSGGQRQAIAVARALLLDPPILVLDEPTSAMDNGAENRLKQRLAQSMETKTMLLVTHRASLLSLIERLIVMDGGQIVADGPREQVLKALAAGQIRAQT
ncbi:MAG: ATP-binding cassette domain-containing protein, partial [Geminicoccales bacterium]